MSWGIRPEEADVHLLALASGALFLTAPLDRATPTPDGQRSFELVTAESRDQYQVSVFSSDRRRDGVYHALLAELMVPLVVESPATTRLVSVRRGPGQRLALTWLFRAELEVHLRLQTVNAKRFSQLRAEQLMKLNQFEGHSLRHQRGSWPPEESRYRPECSRGNPQASQRLISTARRRRTIHLQPAPPELRPPRGIRRRRLGPRG